MPVHLRGDSGEPARLQQILPHGQTQDAVRHRRGPRIAGRAGVAVVGLSDEEPLVVQGVRLEVLRPVQLRSSVHRVCGSDDLGAVHLRAHPAKGTDGRHQSDAAVTIGRPLVLGLPVAVGPHLQQHVAPGSAVRALHLYAVAGRLGRLGVFSRSDQLGLDPDGECRARNPVEAHRRGPCSEDQQRDEGHGQHDPVFRAGHAVKCRARRHAIPVADDRRLRQADRGWLS